MVYEDESSNDLLSVDISSSSDGMMFRIPASIDNEDYMGIENSTLDVCLEHGVPPERRVAFEGFETRIRPRVASHNAKSLLKLWEMLEDSKSGRRDDNLENSTKIQHLTEEKRNLDANYDKLVEDVNQLLNAQEERVMDLSYMKVNDHVKNAIQPEWFLGVRAADEPPGDDDEAPTANLGAGADDDEDPAANFGAGADDDEAPAANLGVVKGQLTPALVVDLLVDLVGGGCDLASLLGLVGAGCDLAVGGCEVPLLACNN
ncbi:hypothetical protein D1007_52020 [Hordeum vulgare]|nr:hypothetical protein D1007_52020 [Hordeum vulgare]